MSAVVTAITLILIYVGSQGLETFDSALIGCAVAILFAIAALSYRYTLWFGRPPLQDALSTRPRRDRSDDAPAS